jgi:hypothetical protein
MKHSAKFLKRNFCDLMRIKTPSKQFQEKYQDFEFKSEENIKNTIEFFKSKNFKIENIISIKNRNPFIFDNNQKNLKQDLADFFVYLSSKYNLDEKEMKFLILTNPECFDYNEEEISKKEIFLKNTFNYKEKDIQKIMKNYPRVFFLSESELLIKKKVIEMFFNTQEKTEEILKLHPYILIAETDRLKNNLYKLSEIGFTSDIFFKMMRLYCLFLFKKPDNILYLQNFFEKGGMKKRDFFELCEKNPFILSMDYSKIFLPKIKIFESKGLNMDELNSLFLKYPWLITKSRNSIITKFRYLEKTIQKNIKEEKYFPKIFLFSYKNFIKPRGEIMYKSKKFDWIGIMKMNDEEFCSAYGVSIEELNKMKSSDFHEKEFDFTQIAYLKYLNKNANEKLYDYPLL